MRIAIDTNRYVDFAKGLPEAVERDYLTPWTAARAEKQFLARFNLLLG